MACFLTGRGRAGRWVRPLLLTISLGSSPTMAAVETTTIAGQVVDPTGVGVTEGTITAVLSHPGSTPDGATSQRVAGRTVGTIEDGDVTLVLVPNDQISPSGTSYQVRYSVRAPRAATWVECWTVATSPDPVAIGAVSRCDVQPGVVTGDYLVYVLESPTGACTASEAPRYSTDDNEICRCDSLNWECTSVVGGGGGGGTSVALDLGNDTVLESSALTRIATEGDTNSVFTEDPVGNRLLIDLAEAWPTCNDVQDATVSIDGDTSIVLSIGAAPYLRIPSTAVSGAAVEAIGAVPFVFARDVATASSGISFRFAAKDSGDAWQEYGSCGAVIRSPTAAAEAGYLSCSVAKTGSLSERYRLYDEGLAVYGIMGATNNLDLPAEISTPSDQKACLNLNPIRGGAWFEDKNCDKVKDSADSYIDQCIEIGDPAGGILVGAYPNPSGLAPNSVTMGDHTVGPYALSSTEGGDAIGLICTDCVELGTETTNPYVADVTPGGGLTRTGTEGATIGLTLCPPLQGPKVNAAGTNYECSPDLTSDGGVGFAEVTSGTNTAAAMVLGTGASLSVSGSGTNEATSVPAAGVDDGGAATSHALFSGAGGAAGFRAITDADVPNSIEIDLATAAGSLAANPDDCDPGEFAHTIGASGDLSCDEVAFSDLSGAATDSQIPDNITIVLAAAADELAANPTNCGTGIVAGGIAAAGTAEDCVTLGGDHLTVTAGVLHLDVEVVTHAKSFTILAPTTDESDMVQMDIPLGATITHVSCSTDTGTSTINVDKRAAATPNTSGTNVLSAGLVCDNDTQSSCSSGCSVDTITAGSVTAGQLLNWQITGVASTPGVLRAHVRYVLAD